jgi:hypothetical protein
MTPDPRFGDARIRPAPFLIVVGGSVALIVGVLAVIGWWTPAPMVVQFRANVVFNEALAIAAAGAATLMLVLGRPAVARVLGAGICVGALLTLLQPLLGVSLGIDTSSGSPPRRTPRRAWRRAPRSSSCSPGCASPCRRASCRRAWSCRSASSRAQASR